jgi:ribose transport system ATP-binding protein
MTTRSALLDVRGLCKDYPGARALAGVDFTVGAGEVHCLVGQNGAGKSTLIKCIAGTVSPTAGEVYVDGDPLPPGDPAAALHHGVATIYQELDLVDDLAVADNIFLGHEARRGGLLARSAMHAEATKLLRRLGHPEIDPRRRVRRLRPATQQVVSIARALSRNVRLLILDEPSAVLGGHEIDSLFAVVRRLAAEGVGVVYVSHRLDEIARIGHRITVLRDGATVATGLPAQTPPDELIRLMVGRRLADVFPSRRESAADRVLEVRGLTHRPDVQDVDLDVDAGEIVGVAGLVGSGRTELLRAIYGLVRPDSGTVRVAGTTLPPGDVGAAIGAGLGFAPEERKSEALWLDWSSGANVAIADLRSVRRGGLLDLAAERRSAARHLTSLGTRPDDPRRPVRELSGGNQQKVVLARWLHRSCRVLLLDEPTRGVDVGAKAEIYRVVTDLAAQGLAVLLVSSDLSELLGLCHRVVVLRDGRVTANVPARDATEEQLLSAAVRGTA